MRYISLVIILLSTSIAYAIDLPTLATKQAIENIRYISKNGKFTYYYSQSGVLQFSTNYSFSIIHKGNKNSQYLMSASELENKILFEKITNPHSQINFQKDNEIYIGSMGKADFKLIAKGKAPKLQLNDSHISYFTPSQQKINILNIESEGNPRSIKLFNKVNPYYTPTVKMISMSDILYSDINTDGHEALLLHTTTEKEIKAVYKSRFPGSKVEYCLINDTIYIGEFPITNLKASSQIVSIDLYNNENFKNIKTIYSSPLPDIGNMICNDSSISFIKTYQVEEKLNFRATDVAKLHLVTKKLKRLTKKTNFTQIFTLSDSIIAPYSGKFFIVDGKINIQDDSLLPDIKK
jgi:hypothetical protein